MRILQICSYYASPLYRLLFDELKKLGVEKNVYYFAVKGTQFESEEGVSFCDCYTQVDRCFFKNKEKKAYRRLEKTVDIESFDLLHAHSLFANGYLALKAKKQYGIPYIVAVRNSDVYAFFKIRPWLRKTGITIMREAERVVFISPSYKDLVLESYVPPVYKEEVLAKSVIIPNGISAVFLESGANELRNPDSTIRVITAGEINRNKNQVAVAEACALLQKQGYDVTYLVVGRKTSNSVCSRLKGFGFVELKEPVTQRELITLYRDSDVFVMPSKTETFGLAYAEAMSQGLPVVYTKGQGFDGWFDNGEVGYAVRPNDREALAISMLNCYEKRLEIGKRNRAYAKQFDWKRISGEYVDLYRGAII